mmetsp:Transcript_263/g.299  ORF Transcript_263/g.299 Transcript_263/m.299 type:complete len:387 (-) Transcript_263:27-1187(-)|eukprot:CAMPEP_0174255200 /NCGR_PEP_ID=MMETSP0439-20130205/4538_1 /TAXON_ID=0 /ORGANISM="Stereomyxa ramosa, Strain Chinc5" /LENGTH=386 /DNA_ID=CAMNT_0015337277 /DNA_START=44 /DNA_END=1204 /DNA_ORIENTATION=+
MLKLLVLVNLFASVFSASWTVVDSNYETIAMSCDFQTATTGWVAGGSSSAQPLLLHTTDGGKTFNNSGIADAAQGALLAIDLADAGHGVTAGLGFAGVLPCGAFTKDGSTWHVIKESNLVCTSQDVVAIDDGNMAIIGQWVTLLDPNGDGMQFSVNGGQNFTARDWKQGTPARYGSCLSKDNCFITGGIWPNTTNTNDQHLTGTRELSRYLRLDGRKLSFNKERIVPHPQQQANDGYQAIIAQATNEGKTWTTVLNMTNQGIYFNAISCTDAQHCWAAGEGEANGAPTAWLYASADGGKTWKLQLTIPNGSLITVKMLSSTFGWAGGALITSGLTGQFYQTTDGTNWKLVQEIKDFYPTALSIIDQNNAYSAGITEFGLSSLARYA